MPHALSGWNRHDYQQRLLITLYCQYSTCVCVDEIFYTTAFDGLYQEFVQLTRSSLSRLAVHLELKALEQAGLLGVVSLCLKCKRLRCNVKAHLCPLCADTIFGARGSYLPPLAEPGSRGVCGVQVDWHPRREDEWNAPQKVVQVL
jgi:hypothetical protein